jgi:hypothetical protein
MDVGVVAVDAAPPSTGVPGTPGISVASGAAGGVGSAEGALGAATGFFADAGVASGFTSTCVRTGSVGFGAGGGNRGAFLGGIGVAASGERETGSGFFPGAGGLTAPPAGDSLGESVGSVGVPSVAAPAAGPGASGAPGLFVSPLSWESGGRLPSGGPA